MSDREVRVSLSLTFPELDRAALAEHLAPVVTAAIAAGGNLTSLYITTEDVEDEP